MEEKTGQLFGDLWRQYDDDLFKESVELFERRWRANGEDPDFFAGKHCLDAGCGGGRYCFALARMGAASVAGVDVGGDGLADARRRVEALGIGNVRFEQASVLDLPFAAGTFDFACCSGVLHHTVSVERGLRELHRVLKPGGSVYLLLYGAGGLYWPLNLVTRAFAQRLGQTEVDRCCASAGFAANKRRTILDDLFVPVLETYTRERVDTLLQESGFRKWRRWEGGRFDQESDARTLLAELEIREQLWRAGARSAAEPHLARLHERLAGMSRAVIEAGRELLRQNESGELSAEALRSALIGCGHHRLIAEK